MIHINTVLRRLGGPQRLVRLLGYPVNIYTIEAWKRDGMIPERYRDRVALALDIDPSRLAPDPDGDAPKLKYRKMGRVYSALIHASGLKPREAATQVHKVPLKTVDEWRNGYAEVPLRAFEEIYAWVKSKSRKEPEVTVQWALRMSGLSQRAFCKRLGVTAAMGTYWRKRGSIPASYRDKVFEIIKEVRADARVASDAQRESVG